MKILPLICYEIIFPELIQKSSSKNKNLIINISEDAWFGGSIGPNQHFAKAIFRAIREQHLCYIARAANKGVSAFMSIIQADIYKKLRTKRELAILELKIPLYSTMILKK